MTTSYEPIDRPEAASLVGEGIHTGLRKGCEGGHPAWQAITDLPENTWHDAVAYFLWGLDLSGFAICKKVEA